MTAISFFNHNTIIQVKMNVVSNLKWVGGNGEECDETQTSLLEGIFVQKAF
jgi:hypothetical protein